MSGTKRIPLNRQHRAPITPMAVELFAQMRARVCTCPDDVRYPTCPGCERKRELKRQLHRELKLKPWEEIADPNVEYYPPGWSPPEDAFARWRALEEGLRKRQADGVSAF